MKKVVIGIILILLFATEALNAENDDELSHLLDNIVQKSNENFLLYLQEREKPDRQYVESINGYDWMLWNQNQKTSYIAGFITCASYIGNYISSWLLKKVPTADASQSQEVESAIATSIYLAAVTSFRFRTTVYQAEIDALYSESWENRDILLADAMYIANERLNGRTVDLSKWRKTPKENN